jgi:hypothetical protein
LSKKGECVNTRPDPDTFSRENNVNIFRVQTLATASFFCETAIAQGQGSWAGGGGLVQLFLVVVALGIALWGAFVYFVARGLGAKGGLLFSLTLTLTLGPPTWFVYRIEAESKVSSDKLVDQQKHNAALFSKAQEYLVAKCQTDRKLMASSALSAAGGIYINSPSQFVIAQRPAEPTKQESDAEEKAIERSDLYIPRKRYHAQYIAPLHWTQQVFQDSVFRQGPLFVEESMGSRSFKRMANYEWWRKNLSPEELTLKLKLYGAGSDLKPDFRLSFDVLESKAKYVLYFRDISTKEDREHWVARGSMQLLDASGKNVLAEYVGFFAHRNPTYGSQYGYEWENVSVCPGAEEKYNKEGNASFDAVSFFFSEIVKLR